MAAPQVSPSRADQFYTHRLANGLQLLGQRMPDLESVSLCFYARTGARDEADPALYGVSHFLEHMVFKGTARRDTEQITLDFNLMGAEFNAFTSVEQTVFYARILHEYLPKAVDLLSDMMRPRLDASDFSMERNVILEEIARSEDVPTGQAYRRLMQTFYANSPLGHDVLGTKDSIREMSVEQMRAYHALRYGANNLIFSIAGNFEWDNVVALVEQACGGWSDGEAGRQAAAHAPDRPLSNVVVKPQLQQQLILVGSPSVSVQDDDLYAALMLLVKRTARAVNEAIRPVQVLMQTSGISNRHVHIHVIPVHGMYDLIPKEMLDALESRDLCARMRSTNDRRSHILVLTDKGRAVLARAKKLVATKHEARLDELLGPANRVVLLEMLAKLAREF